MKKIKELLLKFRHSEDSVYIFAELKKRDEARKAMMFHELKIVIKVALCIALGQLISFSLLALIKWL